jgi:hypothetical protein
MGNRTVYLPAELDEKIKNYKMNISWILQTALEKIIEEIEHQPMCPTCGQKLPGDRGSRGKEAPPS